MRKSKSSSNVLDFWFREILSEQWYKKDPAFDETIRDRFEPTVMAALASRLDSWANNADGCLALILLLDQFTRQLWRESELALSGDPLALELSLPPSRATRIDRS